MDITRVFGTWIWGSSPYETAKKNMSLPTYRKFRKSDTKIVIELWKKCKLIVPWNDPLKDINRKLSIKDNLFPSQLLGGLVGTRTPNPCSEDTCDIHFTTRPFIYETLYSIN